MTDADRLLSLRVRLDGDADAAYLYLAEIPAGAAVEQRVVEIEGRGDVVLDFDREGHLLGVEVLGAVDLLPAALLTALHEDQHPSELEP